MKSSCGAHLSAPNSTAPGSRGPKGEDHRGGQICCSALCKVLISTKKPHQIWSNKQSCTWCKVHHSQHDVVRSWTRRSSWVSFNSRYSILRKLISLLLMYTQYGWKAKKKSQKRNKVLNGEAWSYRKKLWNPQSLRKLRWGHPTWDMERNDEFGANLHAWAALVDKDQALRIALCEHINFLFWWPQHF